MKIGVKNLRASVYSSIIHIGQKVGTTEMINE